MPRGPSNADENGVYDKSGSNQWQRVDRYAKRPLGRLGRQQQADRQRDREDRAVKAENASYRREDSAHSEKRACL